MIALTMLACSPSNPITPKTVTPISVCFTREGDLLRWFGEPNSVSQSAAGKVMQWRDVDFNVLYAVINRRGVVVDWVRNPVGTYMATDRCKKDEE